MFVSGLVLLFGREQLVPQILTNLTKQISSSQERVDGACVGYRTPYAHFFFHWGEMKHLILSVFFFFF